jgi:uncharacterized protein YqjF (DUF2071 family)
MRRFDDAVRQARSLEEVEHRPWPLDSRPWLMGQSWVRLLFAHWRVDHDLLRPHVPKPLELEQYDGSAWVGLTPFRVDGARLRGVPPLPLLSSFHELNCRTYVRGGDRPGIWFFSLDASSRLAVETARRTYKLPYRNARISVDGETFIAERRGEDAAFSATYRGVGEAGVARPGTLEHFLTERYCLYSAGGHLRADIHHPPWPLQQAEASIDRASIAPVPLDGEPLVHYAARQDVVIWSAEPVD